MSLKVEALDEAKQLMGQMARQGDGAIEDLYVTKFVIQQR